jgi:hypothetical protein
MAAIRCARRKRNMRGKHKDCEVLTLVQHFTLLSGLEPSITLRFSFTFRFLFLGIRRSSGGDPTAGRPNRILTGSFVGEESVFRPCLDSRTVNKTILDYLVSGPCAQPRILKKKHNVQLLYS